MEYLIVFLLGAFSGICGVIVWAVVKVGGEQSRAEEVDENALHRKAENK